MNELEKELFRPQKLVVVQTSFFMKAFFQVLSSVRMLWDLNLIQSNGAMTKKRNYNQILLVKQICESQYAGALFSDTLISLSRTYIAKWNLKKSLRDKPLSQEAER